MCDYIDDIMKPLVGGLYHKGHIEMIFWLFLLCYRLPVKTDV